MKNGKLAIGIIGCGGIANQKHMPSLSKLNDQCEMVAFCDLIEERAITAAKQYGTFDAKVYTDYHELLADPKIDVVHVLTPNVSHCPITVAALEAGKHVMCEKPMAATSADAEKMIAAWKKSGKKFTIGYQNRFREEITTLHKACSNGDLGHIYFATATAVRRRGVPTWGVFPNKSLQGGGPLIDIGTHSLDLTLWMMDNYEPLSVTGQTYNLLGTTLRGDEQGNRLGHWDPDTYEVEDSAFGFIKMKNGASIFIRAAWALNSNLDNEAATSLCGTKAGADIFSHAKPGEPKLIINHIKHDKFFDDALRPGSEIAHFHDKVVTPSELEAIQWIDAILNDTEPLVKPEQAIVVTRILEAIYKSSETGKEVML